MYRSASWNRVSDEYSLMQTSSSSSTSSSLSPSPSKGIMRMSFDGSDQQLPLYDQINIAELAKKEKARVKFAENAVHVIPLVLILCALILWLFSTTPVGEIKVGPIGGRIEGLSIEEEIDNGGSDGTQTGVIPTIDLKDHIHMNSPRSRRTRRHKSSKKIG